MISARAGGARLAWIAALALVMLAAYADNPRNRSEVISVPAPDASPSPPLAGLVKDPAVLIRSFGEPDYDQSTIERDSSITRRVTYAIEYVQVVYRTDGPAAAPTPGRPWRLIGFTDPASNAALDPAEALRRLDARKR